MLLVACHIEDNRFHVHPDQFLQHNRPDKVCRAASRVAAVVGAYEMVLPLLKVVGGTIPHFRSAVGAIDHAGKQAALARFRSAVTLLTDLLHLVKDFLCHKRLVHMLHDLPLRPCCLFSFSLPFI